MRGEGTAAVVPEPGPTRVEATYGGWPKFDTIADFFGRCVVVNQLK